MKQLKNNIKISGLMLLLFLAFSSCEDFLNRPTEDSYNVDNFYQTAEQCYQAVNSLYASPWYDMQRFFISAGERMSGNIQDGGAYGTFTVSNSDGSLMLASESLWAVNAHCNGVIENLGRNSIPAIAEVKKTVMGEALVWKAMAYFYLVRCFGGVPIIHNNSELISSGKYNEINKATIPNVYDYIILTLNQAIEWLPEKNLPGRLDRYCAYALLSKVYLTKSGYGKTGSRNQADLDEAAKYAKIVIDKSGRHLMPKYEDIFRLRNNLCEESLIAWRWTSSTFWTAQNSLQSDLGVSGFDEFADNWGDWTGVSVDLQDAFGENALSKTRNNRDTRRKATMMMYGDCYEYFWRDKGGFCWTDHVIGTLKAANLPGTGANCTKHLVGNNADHVAEGGGPMYRMTNGLHTHLLRLAEVYLIYAEAKIGNSASTSDASALDAFNKVFLRAIPGETPKTSITWSDVWKERRLEMALEGDRWYDYVRWSYYDSDAAIAEIRSQRRAGYSGLKDFYTGGSATPDPNTTYYSREPQIPNPAQMYDSQQKSFVFPFPNTDVVSNPKLNDPPVEHDMSQYKY